MNNKEPKKRKSSYNPNRGSYLTADGRYYCYEHWDDENKCMVSQRLEVGKDIPVEWTIMLDESDHDMDLNERYENELKDPQFEASRRRYESDPDGDDAINPWDTLSRPLDSPDYEEEDTENPDIAKVREIVDTQLTPEQQELFYAYFGERKQLEEIRQEEIAASGQEKSLQSVHNRKNKIIKKVAKQAFGVEPIKHPKPNKE